MVTPDDAESLSRWMKSWEQRYAVYRNRDRDASGKLFEQRFESIAITSERQLAATIPYVEVNPTRAGCCDDPADWRWSTYSLHAGTGPTHELISELWQPSSWWLGLSADEAARGEMYRAHTARRLEAMDWRDLHPDSIRFESGGRRRVTPLGGAPKTQRPADLSVGGALLGSGSRGRYFFTSPRAKMLAT